MVRLSEKALTYLNLGIQSEIKAYVFYKKILSMLDDKELIELVEKLAMDEKHHFLQLEDEYDKNVRSEMWAPYKDIMRKEGLPDIDEYISETHEEMLSQLSSIKTKRELLELALILEKEAYEFFNDCYEKVDEPEIQTIFDNLRNFEKGHVLTVENAIKNL